MERTIGIQGSPWNFKFMRRSEFKDNETDGLCREAVKEVLLISAIDVPEEYKINEDTIKKYLQETARHEVIHALLCESGLDNCTGETSWPDDEQVVEFFAKQIPKINAIMVNVDDLINVHIDEVRNDIKFNK